MLSPKQHNTRSRARKARARAKKTVRFANPIATIRTFSTPPEEPEQPEEPEPEHECQPGPASRDSNRDLEVKRVDLDEQPSAHSASSSS